MRIRGVRVDVVERPSWTIYGTAFQVRPEKRQGGRRRRNWGGSNASNELDEGGNDEDGSAEPTQGVNATTRAPSRNNDRRRDSDSAQQQHESPMPQRRWAQFDHNNGPRTHVMEVLWRRICGYRTFNLNLVYPPFLKKNPSPATGGPASLKIPSSSSPSSEDHRRSAFFAFIQTLTNACTGIDRSRPYSSIPSEEWLTSAAAYLVRYAIPSPSSTLSPSQTFPLSSPSPSRSLSSPDGSTTTMSSFYERANSMSSSSSSSSSRKPTPVHAAIHALSLTGDPFKWSHEAVLVTRYRRFAVTRRGYFVLGPDALQTGDVVVVLRGGKVPFVLRKVSVGGGGGGGDDDNEERWVLVGECYVHGLMDGEGWDVEGVEEQVFAIQ
jgi:hypothetical protein